MYITYFCNISTGRFQELYTQAIVPVMTAVEAALALLVIITSISSCNYHSRAGALIVVPSNRCVNSQEIHV